MSICCLGRNRMLLRLISGMKTNSRGWERILREVREYLLKIVENPRSFPVDSKFREFGIRKARLNRFKFYSIIFELIGKSIVVYAIFHASRDPRELKRRLP